jgi:hypothetical protein
MTTSAMARRHAMKIPICAMPGNLSKTVISVHNTPEAYA